MLECRREDLGTVTLDKVECSGVSRREMEIGGG